MPVPIKGLKWHAHVCLQKGIPWKPSKSILSVLGYIQRFFRRDYVCKITFLSFNAIDVSLFACFLYRSQTENISTLKCYHFISSEIQFELFQTRRQAFCLIISRRMCISFNILASMHDIVDWFNMQKTIDELKVKIVYKTNG